MAPAMAERGNRCRAHPYALSVGHGPSDAARPDADSGDFGDDRMAGGRRVLRARRGQLGRRARTALRSAGLPLDHLGLYLRTLHPEILGHTIGWAPDEPVQVYGRPHD